MCVQLSSSNLISKQAPSTPSQSGGGGVNVLVAVSVGEEGVLVVVGGTDVNVTVGGIGVIVGASILVAVGGTDVNVAVGGIGVVIG